MPCTKFLKLTVLSFSFGIFAHPVAEHGLMRRDQQQHLASTESYTLVNSTSGVRPYRKYMTTNATSPKFVIERSGQAIAPGSLFLTLSNLLGTGENWQGAVIMSSDGDLVWAGPKGATSNFRKQTYNNNPVITTWTGDGSAAAAGGASHGYGQVQIYNFQYEVIQTVCPTATDLNIQFSPGTTSTCVCDVHESYIKKGNIMLVTVYNLTQADLTSAGGPQDGWITNSLFVEVDIETSKALFVWNPLDHVPISATHESWQHDARLHSEASSDKVLYTVFNDYNGDFSTKNPSTGITLILDMPANNSKKSLQPYAYILDPAQPLPALAEGSYQLIHNDTAFLGYGVFPIVKEFNLRSGSSSNLKYTAHFAYENYTASSYRSFKFDWHATPCAPIDLVIAAVGANATTGGNYTAPGYGSGSFSGSYEKTGYVSWKGATDVTTYGIFAQSNGSGDCVDTGYFFDKKGFETAFEISTGLPSIQIVAFDGSKELVRSSTTAV
ncbi:hypothetical protein LTR78_010816 [Recurvomyces mirabilis]|uniref:Acid protease n=1 Tax=Recurvomyces mirabilis TaxID=574656 RepID=A0AAE0TM41_9PEZI|nr:hypothetical protein LTR78_010816 [Recurvomyces mirabilis]KAK5156320.1 hypothetical protein LTS14_005208 [Recurvomyces mirabilis]